MQLSFIQLDDPILEEIKQELIDIDINSLTPVEALMKLNSIKEKVNPKKNEIISHDCFLFKKVIIFVNSTSECSSG